MPQAEAGGKAALEVASRGVAKAPLLGRPATFPTTVCERIKAILKHAIHVRAIAQALFRGVHTRADSAPTGSRQTRAFVRRVRTGGGMAPRTRSGVPGAEDEFSLQAQDARKG